MYLLLLVDKTRS